MRRITLWAMSTLSGVVLLMSYPTSHNESVAAPGTGVGSVNGTTSTSAAAGGATGQSAAGSTAGGSDASESTGDSMTSTPSASATSSTSSGSAASGSSSGSSSSAAKSYTGDAIMTRYGNVQVKITVQDGKVITSEVTQVPWNDHHDQEINANAVPILNQEAVAKQSAELDMVSGATFTSEGYMQSLQSALDQAGI